MAKETTKIKVVVILKNGDSYKVSIDTLDMDTNGITLYPTSGGSVSVKFVEIDTMSIAVDSDECDETLIYHTTYAPKVRRED